MTAPTPNFPANALPEFKADTYLDDRTTIVSFHFERSKHSTAITFYFTGGHYGTHTVFEAKETPTTWERAEAHWKGYIAANNGKAALDTIKSKLTSEGRKRIASAIAECDRYIAKEAPRADDIRPAMAAQHLTYCSVHRAALRAMLEG
jgi:hypothetical protein